MKRPRTGPSPLDVGAGPHNVIGIDWSGAKLAGKTNVMLPAVGCGKLATCSENFGCAVASLALATDCAPTVTVVAGLLGVVSLDMACRSLSYKLRARC